MYKIAMLEMIVSKDTVILATKLVNSYDFWLSFRIFTTSCKILPPSNGYIGSKLKIASNMLAYII